jgi:hypothetical protein
MMALGNAKSASSKYAFYLDSASSRHICSDLSLLFDYVELEEPEYLETAKVDVLIEVVGKGSLKYEWNGSLVEIKDVFYSPDSNAILFSNSAFDDKNAKTVVWRRRVDLETPDGNVFMSGKRFGPLYLMEISTIENPSAAKVAYQAVKFEERKVTFAKGTCFYPQGSPSKTWPR